jgi:hypothetical protein
MVATRMRLASTPPCFIARPGVQCRVIYGAGLNKLVMHRAGCECATLNLPVACAMRARRGREARPKGVSVQPSATYLYAQVHYQSPMVEGQQGHAGHQGER